jgi:ABC-type multidrug transport system ATPase subunit
MTIRVEQLTFSYAPHVLALDVPALEIGAGVTLVVGPNGAGKSTLLRLLAGVERPDRGTVSVAGRDLWGDEAAARMALAYVPDHPDVTPYATAGELLAFVASLRGLTNGAVDEALRRTDLGALTGRTIRELSFGQRRRLLYAAAFMSDPQVAILDEPLDGLDAAFRDTVLGWIREMREAGRCVVASSHDVASFAPLATATLRVEAGRVAW